MTNLFQDRENARNYQIYVMQTAFSYTVYTDKEIITEKLKYNVLYYYNENKKKEASKKGQT